MGDTRQPNKTILVRRGHETEQKIEIFNGDLFPGTTFTSLLGTNIPAEGQRTRLYRLRVNGKWFPPGKKVLLARKELREIITTLIGDLK